MKLMRALASSVLITCLPLVCQAQATQATTAEAQDKSITPIEEQVIDRTVIVAQLHIAQARAYIHKHALQKAKNEVTEAQRLMHALRYDLSSTVAGERISIARRHLEFETTGKVMQDLPAVYRAIEQMKGYLATDDAKRHVTKAESFLKTGDKVNADRELALAQNSLPAIEEELPLLTTEKYLAAAARQLSAGDPKKADLALEVAERSMLAATAETPIQRAERNLRQATREYATGHLPEAKTDLDQAAQYLAMAARTGLETAQEEIGKLTEEIVRLKGQIAKGDKDRQSIVQSFWERGKALAERSGDYLVARLESEKRNPVKENLIEAKMHVAYARSYQLTAGEPELVVKEIERAESYLDQVRKTGPADPVTVRKLAALVKELEYLKLHPAKSEAGTGIRYNAIKTALNDLLKTQ